MKIGIFDSGLGGLVVAREVRKLLPKYDYIYLGDTKNLPYGSASQEKIYEHTVKAVKYLFAQDCVLVVVACNTASSRALRKIQQEWLPARIAAQNVAGGPKSEYKGRKVLGVIRPTAELAGKYRNIGLVGTVRTIDSSAYAQELKKINKNIKLLAKATPKLVPMIEAGKYDKKILENYLKPFKNCESLILGCTHYGMLKKEIQEILGKKVKIIAQENLIPQKLKTYLSKHKEISKKLSRKGRFELLVTKLSPGYNKLALDWFARSVKPKVISLKKQDSGRSPKLREEFWQF